MSRFDALLERARQAPQRVVMSEGTDTRIVEGSLRASREGIAKPVLIGPTDAVEAELRSAGGDDAELEIIDPASSELTAAYAEAFFALRKHKNVDQATARQTVKENPLVFAAMMVREGAAGGTIGGAVATTADTVRAALQIVGRAPGVATVSSFFMMLLENTVAAEAGIVVFADGGLVIDPNPEELMQIALSSANSYRSLVGEEPRVAMLSFSTAGSARHSRVDRVKEATAKARSECPDLLIDGELQFDAAFVPKVAAAKAPDSPLAGRANVFVFPSLEAANIGYKIAQRIGGAKAIGPVLQGLRRPANDLSRGCSADDVFNLIAVTSIQASE